MGCGLPYTLSGNVQDVSPPGPWYQKSPTSSGPHFTHPWGSWLAAAACPAPAPAASGAVQEDSPLTVLLYQVCPSSSGPHTTQPGGRAEAAVVVAAAAAVACVAGPRGLVTTLPKPAEGSSSAAVPAVPAAAALPPPLAAAAAPAPANSAPLPDAPLLLCRK
jgi:hypothetical protein